jgi:DNA ligase (NAD+)
MSEMRNLIDRLNELGYYYYVLDEPKVSDKEYDALYDRLVALEKQTGIVYDDSPTKRVGGDIISAFKSVKHRSRLYSLDKCNSEGGLYEFEKRINKLVPVSGGYTVEYKYDGLTLNLTYENGSFVRAATRGNGIIGEDVTAQVLTIRSVPLKIPFKGILEVQGEGIMTLSQLKKYNETAAEPLKNARNAVAGAIRNLDPKITAKRNPDVIFYAVNYIEGERLNSQKEVFDFLKENRFKTGAYALCSDMACVINEINAIKERKSGLDYLIDGAVVKINDFRIRDILGYTDKFPRWAIAYKFEAEEVTTIVENVVWNVGRTGKLTPLALLSPVELSGATVKRATLNNYGDIMRKKIKKGCRVLVRRSNEVIPEILGATEYYEGNEEISKPSRCPDCGALLNDDGVNLYCPNFSCPPQVTGRLEHFGSKNAMDIEGFSEMTAAQLYKDLGIDSPDGLYRLTPDVLQKLDGFKQKKSENLIKSIEKSKNVDLDRFLYALAIPNIGVKSAKDMAKKFGTFEKVMNATQEELLEIEDFGKVMSESVINYFQNAENRQMISRLLEHIKIKENERKTGAFSGEKVVLTGSLSRYSRSEAAAIIEREGGELQSSVGKKTTLLICGQDAGSKLDKAKALGIKIIDEEEFINRLNNK